jgi:hypothetical protein
MLIVRDIFALLMAAAGWHYLFYSAAASRLRAVEAQSRHRARVLLRRFNGVLLLAMAVLFFIGSQPWLEKRELAYLTVWLSVMALLFFIVIGAFIDLRLTLKLKAERRIAVKHSDDQS